MYLCCFDTVDSVCGHSESIPSHHTELWFVGQKHVNHIEVPSLGTKNNGISPLCRRRIGVLKQLPIALVQA
jgi:hypothetical protein